MKTNLLYLLSFYFISGCAPTLSPSSYEGSSNYKPINETYTAGRSGVSLRRIPKIFAPVSKNIQVGDTVYVYGRLNHDWYVVRRNGRKYFAPFRNIYQFRTTVTTAKTYQPIPDSSTLHLIHIPLLAE
ncbi:SH3 domain-containing protein [Adhaeribacter radiodurans]|uniref:SH3 domain-containing protein n=1 Tax=Adhaeribacter radiodurans TaxID=2745197 RepID=A0A7L7LFP2_9BACT|nr:SH3 domain-containing protein [Adhaeribacter radiodurans]QMU31335.1 SH3 domain-containing protein [Adhaeribacter radiodurans]